MLSAKVPSDTVEKLHTHTLKKSTELKSKRRSLDKAEAKKLRERDLAMLREQRKLNSENLDKRVRQNERNVTLPQVNGPFNGLPGATFLNAIYAGNHKQINSINDYYGSMQAAGLKKFFGSLGNKMTDAMANAYKHVRIQDSVAAKYLFDYEKNYGLCLSESPVVFYVTGYQPDIVFTNLLGVEIARQFGGKTKTKYLINKPFTQVFQRVGKMKPEGLMSNVTGMFASQGEVDLRKASMEGIDLMYQKFACDSSEIKRFEKNLISLF